MLDTCRYRAKKDGEVTMKLFDSELTIPKDWFDSPKGAKEARTAKDLETPEEEIDLLTAKILEQGTLEILDDDNSTGNGQ